MEAADEWRIADVVYEASSHEAADDWQVAAHEAVVDEWRIAAYEADKPYK